MNQTSAHANRTRLFRQADRAWARALTLLLGDPGGARAFNAMTRRCLNSPSTSQIWFRGPPELMQATQSHLFARRRLAARVRLSCDGLDALIDELAHDLDADLAHRVQAARHWGHGVLQQLVRENMGLIYHWAWHTSGPSSEEREDIEQTGMMALVRAAQRFDVERGSSFSSCVEQWYRHHVTRYRDSMRFQVTPTRKDHKARRQIHALLQQRQVITPCPQDIQEIATTLGLESATVRELVGLDHCEQPLDALDCDHLVSSAGPDTTLASVCERERGARIETMLATLDPQTRQVLRLRFGLEGAAPETVATIAKALGISTETVRTRYNAGLKQLHVDGRLSLLHAEHETEEAA